jgi:hypothetical protein
MKARTLLLSAVSIGLLVGSYAQPAQAQIEVGQGMAGVSLGDSKGKVRAALGKPFRAVGETWFFGKPCLCTARFKKAKAASLDTLSKTERTSAGIGPGSSFEETTAAYPEAVCYHPKVYGPTSEYCVLRSTFKSRNVKTVFAFFEKDLGVRDVEIRWH